jgi:mannose-1-phosphate guanylyltransferase
MSSTIDFRPIILAGGSGTRFWPRSRRDRPKQVLALDGERTMIQQTMDRLAPLAPAENLWVITNDLLAAAVGEQLTGVPGSQIVREPAARNTAPAAGLAAFLVERIAPDAIIGIFPSDHVVADQPAFIAVLRRAIALAAAGENVVILGIQPTRPEVGYGYIETGAVVEQGVLRVRGFTEKPDLQHAEEFLAAGNYCWNSGMFIWSARTLANAMREHLPQTAILLQEIAAAFGTPDFDRVFADLYPQCENISLDFAILEPRSAKGEQHSNLYCIPASFGWNDLGSWDALYEHRLAQPGVADEQRNVVECARSLALDSTGNYVFSPGKFVALVGVNDLVVVETDDAILVTTRERAQDVGNIVKQLKSDDRDELI